MSAVHRSLYVFLALILLSGCGGQGSRRTTSLPASVGRGEATVTFRWPDRSVKRLIPVEAASIRIILTDGTATVAEQIISRPTNDPPISNVTFTNLPLTALSVTSTAYPHADGTGVAQATASTSVTIVPEQTTSLTLTMESTIDHIDVPITTVGAGYSVSLGATARNASNEIVLTGPLQYASAKRRVATVDDSGILVGENLGTSNVTITEAESGKRIVVPVTVTKTAEYVVKWLFPNGLPPDTTYILASGLNNHDVVVGHREGYPNGEFQGNAWMWKPHADDYGGDYIEMGHVSGSTDTRASRVNDSGRVCGWCNRQSSEGWWWEDGTFHRLTGQNGSYLLEAYDMNNHGMIVGHTLDANNHLHPGIWKDGVITLIPNPDGVVQGEAWAINDEDTVAGDFYYPTTDNRSDARLFYWKNGITTVLQAEEMQDLRPQDINLSGAIVGFTISNPVASSPWVPTMWQNSIASPLELLPGAVHSYSSAIAEDGSIVGNTFSADFGQRTAVRWRNGKVETLLSLLPPANQSIFTINEVYAINQSGVMCGIGSQGPYLMYPQVEQL